MAKFLSVEPIRGLKTFRRAGFEFNEGKPTLIREDELDDEKRERLQSEASLAITEVELSDDDARARGWSGAVGPGEVNDPRTPLEQAYGDYPPPNARQQAAAGVPKRTERSPIKPTPAEAQLPTQADADAAADAERAGAAAEGGETTEEHGRRRRR